ncbi:MAG: hypothetical protein O3C57_03890 [Verrucomicrobia bacterium]|nr:hypothetical protein [Verrucomicrobiota bacterium]
MNPTRRQEAAAEIIGREAARKSLTAFIPRVWWMPHPLAIGTHTRTIAKAMTRAVDRFKAGKSTYLDIEVAFRHGKSDLSSRAFPAFALGALRDHEPDLMLLAHSESLANNFSRDVKSIMESRSYQSLFPGVLPAYGRDAVGSWSVADSHGVATFTGLGGSYVGKGAAVLVVDDWFAGKADARSEKIRKARWEGFTDALSRLAPVHIVLCVATSWHVDGVRARIKKAEREQAGFPQFEHLSFPAKVMRGGTWGGKYLFPERFGREWYEAMYASQGHWASALLDCQPVTDGGNRFDVSRIQYHDSLSEFPSIQMRRCWDLASSKKERDKDDPDSTVGVLGCVTGPDRNRVRDWQTDPQHLWIADCVAGQWEAPERNRRTRDTATRDGQGVPIYVEAFGAYKDAYTTLRAALTGVRVVRKSKLPGDKSAKLADLEPIFDAGNVHLLRAPWNAALVSQFAQFPDGKHDDYCDATSILYHESRGGGTQVVAMT